MKNIEMKTPEGYFEGSFARTMSGVSAIRSRRKAVLGAAVAIVLIAGVAFTASRISYIQEEKAFLAQQTELADLDIFLEIN